MCGVIQESIFQILVLTEVRDAQKLPSGDCDHVFQNCHFSIRVFAIDTRLPIMAMLASEVFTAAKSRTQTGDHWTKSLILMLLS